MKFISSLPKKKCHILTIIGKTKTGKSTLMNQLFKSIQPSDSSEVFFEVNDGIGGGTRGAFILRKYIELDDDSILLLVDTEGLGNLGNS
jgi:predicted GTPase